MGFVVFGRFPSSLAAAAGHAALVAAGGSLQAVLVGVRPPTRFTGERRAISHALALLAMQAHGVAGRASGAPAGAALADATDLLDRRLDMTDTEILRSLVDAAGRVRLELSALVTVSTADGVVELSQATAVRLRQLAQAVATRGEPPPDDGALHDIAERMKAAADPTAGISGVAARHASARAQALLGQLRAIDRQVTALSGLRRFVLPPVVAAPTPVLIGLGGRVSGITRRLRLAATDPTSTAWRHAVRLSATLVVTEIVAVVVPWQRGYWVTLTAVVVLRPDYGATVQRGAARVVGTAAGAMLAGLLIDGLHPAEPVEVGVLALLAWATYAVFAASYALFSLVVSALVVLLLSPAGAGSLSTAADRGLSTLVGGALAVVAMLVWPTWERTALPAALSRLLHALARYAGVVIGGYVDPGTVDSEELATAADDVRRSRAAAQASRDRAAAEPARVAADVSTATGVLAGAWRIAIALHALRTTLEDSTVEVALPEAEPIRDGVLETLGSLAAGGDAAVVTALRERQQRLVAAARDPAVAGAAGEWRARRLALLAAQLDPLVDSVDTVAHLLEQGNLRVSPEAAGA